MSFEEPDFGDDTSFETAVNVSPPRKVNGSHFDAESDEVQLVRSVLGDPSGEGVPTFLSVPVGAFQLPQAIRLHHALRSGVQVDDAAAIIKAARIPWEEYVELSQFTTSAKRSINADNIRRSWKQRRVCEIASDMARSPGTDPATWRKALDELDDEAAARHTVRPITSFGYPSADDPNVLLGNDDYLGRGGGFLFVSHAGAGKSSWVMQACMSWSLGRPWMGLRSNGPVKSLIIQAEDSDRYIGKIQASFAHVNKLTKAETAQVAGNCVIVRVKGLSGAAFFAELRRLVQKEKPDLVVINPIYLYAEGDIARSEFAQPFLVGLDAINKEEKFAYLLIHHTGKPQAKGTNGKRAEVEDWESVYMGFGSSYLANWPRCSALLEPKQGQPGKYNLKLGKGGLNAGITREVEQGAGKRFEAVTRISLRHSVARMEVEGKDRPVYYWEPYEEDPEDAPGVKNLNMGGAPKKGSFAEYVEFFPRGIKNGKSRGNLYRIFKERIAVSESTFNRYIMEWVRDGLISRDDSNVQFPRYYMPEA